VPVLERDSSLKRRFAALHLFFKVMSSSLRASDFSTLRFFFAFKSFRSLIKQSARAFANLHLTTPSVSIDPTESDQSGPSKLYVNMDMSPEKFSRMMLACCTQQPIKLRWIAIELQALTIREIFAGHELSGVPPF
jgi:hypothetical protein